MGKGNSSCPRGEVEVMGGIFQGDIIIKTAIDLGIEDMRKNPWLIEHMLEDLTQSPYLKEKYGQKQIDACKEWFANNQIDVYMRLRDDRDRTPFVSITMGPSNEKPEMKTEGDLSPYKKILYPNVIGKPIPYVIKPFMPVDYDPNTGAMTVPSSVDLSLVAPNMILVNPANGTGYVIQSITASQLFVGKQYEIEATELGIVPQFQFYEARIEQTFFEETYTIECHAHGDMQTVMWLWSIVESALLRYRQSLLEGNGFAESVISSGPPHLNGEMSHPGGEKVYTRSINLSGQVRNTWIKAPHRLIENVSIKEVECDSYVGGIKILSNLQSPSFINAQEQLWTTVADPGDDSDE
jgi:hypothetical protein